MSSTLRVVHKSHYNRQTFISPPLQSLGPLAASSVRVRTTLIGLTSNNLSYCASGAVLHWWDTFPVPEWLEAPYNDRTQYGISPGWGYGTILDSTVPALKAGSVLWGFFPISTFPVDLLVQQSVELETHFIEVSPHRAKVMPLYQRYIAVSDALDEINSVAAWKAMLKPVWEAAYLYNRFNFASEPDSPRIHPGLGHSWTESDANLKEALIICLGAGSKTSRSFEHQLATNRAAGSGPVAVLEVSSSTSGSSPFGSRQTPFSHKKTTYADLQSPALSDWLFSQPIAKFIIIDFAGRTGVCESLATQLRAHAAAIPVEVFFVGTEAKMYTTDDLAERSALIARLDAVRCNASKVRQGRLPRLGRQSILKIWTMLSITSLMMR